MNAIAHRLLGHITSRRRPIPAASPPPVDDAAYSNAEVIRLVLAKTKRAASAPRIDVLVPGDIMLPTLLGAAMSANRVLDFGGAAGFHYLFTQRMFPSRRFRWAVVERPEMVAAAAELSSDCLQFFDTIEGAAAWLGHIDMLHSNGTLNYVDAPEHTLDELLSLKASTVTWARTLVGKDRRIEEHISPLSAHGPGPALQPFDDRPIMHRAVRLMEREFISAHSDYDLRWRGADAFIFSRRLQAVGGSTF